MLPHTLPPELLLRTPKHHDAAPRPAREVPRRGEAMPAVHDETRPTPPLAAQTPRGLRVFVGRALIRLGQRLAGDAATGGLRPVSGAE